MARGAVAVTRTRATTTWCGGGGGGPRGGGGSGGLARRTVVGGGSRAEGRGRWRPLARWAVAERRRPRQPRPRGGPRQAAPAGRRATAGSGGRSRGGPWAGRWQRPGARLASLFFLFYVMCGDVVND